MSYTAKSVIIDCADNHSAATYMGMRAIEFYFEGSKLSILSADFTAFATSTYSGYSPSYAFDTSLSKTGTYSGKNWISNLQLTNQRLIIVFDTSQTFDAVIINNSHHNGGEAIVGMKTVKIHTSTDSITSTTYDESIANSTLIFDGEFDKHTDVNEENDRRIVLESDAVPGYIAKSLIIDAAQTWGGSTYVMGFRSLELSYDSSVLALTAADYTADATTDSGVFYAPEMSFDTSLDKDGAAGDNQWFSVGLTNTNQRILVVFNIPQFFDDVIINNSHDSGGETHYGIKNAKIHISTDAITSTVYDEAIDNAQLIFDGEFDQHAASDVADDQTLTLEEPPAPLSEFSAKSVILDIADCWGSPYFMAVRQVDFYFEDNLLALTDADYTTYATTTYSDRYSKYAFDTSLSRTGSDTAPSNCQWYSGYPGGHHVNQRLIVVFDTAQTFDSIRVSNAHDTGSDTDFGLKNTEIWISSTAITSTVYGEVIANSNLIFDDIITEHSAVSTQDPEDLTLIPLADLGETVVVPEMELNISLSLRVIGPGDVVLPEMELTISADAIVSINTVVVIPEFSLTTGIEVTISINTVVVMPEITLTTGMGAVSINIFSLKNSAQIYLFTLTGAKDSLSDLEMPIANFQTNMRSGKPTFLTVTVPTYDYASEIIARSNGTLKVEVAYNYKGEILQRNLLVAADFDTLTTYAGTSSKSVVLQGYKTTTYTQKSIILEGLQLRSMTNGKYRYRFSKANVYLNPGDEVTIGLDTFNANVISYYVSPLSQYMEVAEE